MFNGLRTRLRKLPRFLITGTLTIGVSLMLGLLSFGGMYAIWPLWPVALISFVLSSVYEGEIYIQNIRGAFKKLFSPYNQLQQKLAKQYLIELLSNYPENAPELPMFFHDYLKLLRRQEQLEQAHATHHELEKIANEIIAAEVWFSKQLFRNAGKSHYAQAVIQWLDQQHAQEQARFRQLFKKVQRARNLAAGFSLVLSSSFMGIGTVYLLSETFAVIPLLAALPLTVTPFAIVPLAIFAGIAYGFLTYHTITDMIERNTFQKMIDIFRAPWQNVLSPKERTKKALLCLAVIGLVLLAVALTICTAGTWWTIAKQVHPLLPRISNIFRSIFAGVTAVVNGLSSLAFNWQNTMESVEGLTHQNETPHAHHHLRDLWNDLRQQENLWQIFNPFRILLVGTIYPLRCIFFLGHVISIGVISDRIPNVNMFVSALLGILSETIEDWHYFFGHDHHHLHHHHAVQNITAQELLQQHGNQEGHNHDHSLDLPTRIIKAVFSPVYGLARGWNWVAEKYGPAPMPATLSQQPLIPMAATDPVDITTSVEWKNEGILARLQSFEEQHFRFTYNPSIAKSKKQIFADLQAKLINVKCPRSIRDKLNTAANNPIIKAHRFFATSQPTASQALLEAEIGLLQDYNSSDFEGLARRE